MAKAYRTDVVGKKKFQEEIRQRRNALKPERVPCPLPGCECTYEMYGPRSSNPEDNVATLQERLKREHPDHTSEVLAVNEFRKVPRCTICRRILGVSLAGVFVFSGLARNFEGFVQYTAN